MWVFWERESWGSWFSFQHLESVQGVLDVKIWKEAGLLLGLSFWALLFASAFLQQAADLWPWLAMTSSHRLAARFSLKSGGLCESQRALCRECHWRDCGAPAAVFFLQGFLVGRSGWKIKEQKRYLNGDGFCHPWLIVYFNRLENDLLTWWCLIGFAHECLKEIWLEYFLL